MRILVDMNLSPRWVQLLATAGHDAAHWATVGPPNAPDSEIMAFAKANGSIVLTHDLDFSAMLAKTGATGPSVLQVRSDELDPDRIGAVVLAAVAEISRRPSERLLVTVEPKRTRMRLLPFPSPQADS